MHLAEPADSASQMPAIEPDERSLSQIMACLRGRADAEMPVLMPTRARKRLGRLGRDLLSELMADMAAGASDAALEERVGKLQFFYAAVLLSKRDGNCNSSSNAADHPDAAEPDPITAPADWKVIRARLQLAEAGR